MSTPLVPPTVEGPIRQGVYRLFGTFKHEPKCLNPGYTNRWYLTQLTELYAGPKGSHSDRLARELVREASYPGKDVSFRVEGRDSWNLARCPRHLRKELRASITHQAITNPGNGDPTMALAIQFRFGIPKRNWWSFRGSHIKNVRIVVHAVDRTFHELYYGVPKEETPGGGTHLIESKRSGASNVDAPVLTNFTASEIPKGFI